MKRTFSSYGPVDTDINYYVPRKEIRNRTISQLIGGNIEKGGHYFTVWAPRQTGKTWMLNHVYFNLKEDERFFCVKIELQIGAENFLQAANFIIKEINKNLGKKIPLISNKEEFYQVFTKIWFEKPLILILDEFDDFNKETIHEVVSVFRNLYTNRSRESTTAFEKEVRLHGLALIGVRSVMGVDNKKGSPFNVQRSVKIPNLTYNEVKEMYDWYTRDTGQVVEKDVVDGIYSETSGQPGLVSWFGELLTEVHNSAKEKPITLWEWNYTWSDALQVQPNNTIMNLISKAIDPEHQDTVLKLFRTSEKLLFAFDNKNINYLYMNGIIDYEEVIDDKNQKVTYAKFSCAFVQKRLFRYFSNQIFDLVGDVAKPFEDLSDSVTEEKLHIKNILRRYEQYIQNNKDWVLKQAPRRKDGRIFEATWHFNFYRFLDRFLDGYKVSIYPEFPTGNGKVDLLLYHNNKQYAIELKSFSSVGKIKEALNQAAGYANQLKTKHITLAVFTDYIDDESRTRFEVLHTDEETGVQVNPVFVRLAV